MPQQYRVESPTRLDYARRARPPGGYTGLTVVASVNVISILAAVIWAVYSWRENIHERGWWSLWPLAWLVGSVVLVVLQVLLTIVPTYLILSKRRREFPTVARTAIWVLALTGLICTVGGFAAVCIYDSLTPAPHTI